MDCPDCGKKMFEINRYIFDTEFYCRHCKKYLVKD